MRTWAKKNVLTADLISKIGATLVLVLIVALFWIGEQAVSIALAIVLGGAILGGMGYAIWMFSYAAISCIVCGEPIEKWQVKEAKEERKEERRKERGLIDKEIEEWKRVGYGVIVKDGRDE